MSKRAQKNVVYDINHRPPRCSLKFTKPSKTVQSMYSDVNIHEIQRLGMNKLPANTIKPLYGFDLSDIGDLNHALNVQADLKNSFNSLSKEVQEKFHYNPEELITYVQNKSDNYEEGFKLGIYGPKESPTVFEQNMEKIANFFDKQASNATPEVIPNPSE